MPELIPSQRVSVEIRPGWVVPAWATFWNEDTGVVEYEWVSPLGVRQTGWCPLASLVEPGLGLPLREAG